MSAEWIYQTIATVTAAWRGIVRYLDGASSETDEQVHLCA
jgi:hypothetical protein